MFNDIYEDAYMSDSSNEEEALDFQELLDRTQMKLLNSFLTNAMYFFTYNPDLRLTTVLTKKNESWSALLNDTFGKPSGDFQHITNTAETINMSVPTVAILNNLLKKVFLEIWDDRLESLIGAAVYAEISKRDKQTPTKPVSPVATPKKDKNPIRDAQEHQSIATSSSQPKQHVTDSYTASETKVSKSKKKREKKKKASAQKSSNQITPSVNVEEQQMELDKIIPEPSTHVTEPVSFESESKKQSTLNPEVPPYTPVKKRKERSSDEETTHIITGYTPNQQDLAFVYDLIIYDIPAAWNNLKVLQEFKQWGNVISISRKTQKKYQTVRIKIELNLRLRQTYERGDWIAPLAGIPVRWFPASWSLAERKERERFQAAAYDIPESLTTENLTLNNELQPIIHTNAIKAFKIVQTVDKKRKLICFLESWESLQTLIRKKSTWDGHELDWCRHVSPSKSKISRSKNFKNKDRKSKGVASGSNKTTLGSRQEHRKDDKKKNKANKKPKKEQNTKKHSSDRVSKKKLMAEIKEILLRLVDL